MRDIYAMNNIYAIYDGPSLWLKGIYLILIQRSKYLRTTHCMQADITSNLDKKYTNFVLLHNGNIQKLFNK